MDILDLRKKQIVTKDGHFMPIVFADLPAAACGAGVMKLCHEIGKQIKDNKFSLPQKSYRNPYVHICEETMDMEKLSLSIVDITF